MKAENKKENRGGARPGAGNPYKRRVAEKRIQISLSILPSVLNPFKKKHGRKWGRKVEEMIKSESD